MSGDNIVNTFKQIDELADDLIEHESVTKDDIVTTIRDITQTRDDVVPSEKAVVDFVQKTISSLVPDLIPFGIMTNSPMMFTGALGGINNRHPINIETNEPDTNWELCDGINGTPDLRDRFIMGGDGTNTGVTGGTNVIDTVTGDTTLTIAQIPPHTHGSIGDGSAHWGQGIPVVNGQVYIVGPTGSTGGGEPHNHTVAYDNRPSFYTMVFIIKKRDF